MSSAAEINAGVTQMYQTTVKAFEDGVKTSVKGLEELFKFWSGSVQINGTLDQWQKHSKAVLDRTTPAVQKSADEFIKLGEESYKRSTELLKKAVQSDGHSSFAQASAHGKKLWEATLEAVRENAQAAAQTNVRVVELWADVLRKNVAQAQSLVGTVAATAKGK